MEDFNAFILIPIEVIISILRFFPRSLIDDVAPFKGLYDTARHRRIGAAPQVPHVIEAVRIALVIGFTDQVLDLIHEGSALYGLPSR